MINLEPHPLLDMRAFVSVFPTELGTMQSNSRLKNLLTLDAAAPLSSDDNIRKTVRDLLRHGGFKPTGRSKPASEYLIKAAAKGQLNSINVAVDACNAVSLHSGLPISVVDLDLVREPLRVGIADPGTSYVFNQSGQVMDIGGLLCLIDADGPCGNAVKDSQRTKTSENTMRTLSLIWGASELLDRSQKSVAWYQDLLSEHDATIKECPIECLEK